MAKLQTAFIHANQSVDVRTCSHEVQPEKVTYSDSGENWRRIRGPKWLNFWLCESDFLKAPSAKPRKCRGIFSH